MLKSITRRLYKEIIFTDEPEIFYEFYKWEIGLEYVFELRNIFYILIALALLSIPIDLAIKIWLLMFYCIPIVSFETVSAYNSKNKEIYASSFDAGAEIMVSFFRKHFVSQKGALSKSDWRKIKKQNHQLYNELLSNVCNHRCYYYSLEIARFVNDAVLIWCAILEPLENSNQYYAHSVVLKNGIIYDTNRRNSLNFEEFKKLYKIKVYKTWSHSECLAPNFRENEREAFYKWCQENHIISYEEF